MIPSCPKICHPRSYVEGSFRGKSVWGKMEVAAISYLSLEWFRGRATSYLRLTESRVYLLTKVLAVELRHDLLKLRVVTKETEILIGLGRGRP